MIDEILSDLRNGDFHIEDHCYQRMVERRVREVDIQSVGHTCSGWLRQVNGRYKIKGRDCDGDDLTVVCSYEGETLIITVF
jgi:hypothetical protein